MKLQELMTRQVVQISPEETVAVAARRLAQYNIGSMPVCSADGALKGVVTDRDLVTRCMAAGKSPEQTKVREVMSAGVISAAPEMEVSAAAHLMGRHQIRRLPVVEQGQIRGMVSLGDLANREESVYDATDALADISCNISVRD